MRNGRIQRDRHFRRVGAGEFELNVTEYLEWLREEKDARKLPFLERVSRSIEDGDKRFVKAVTEARAKAPPPAPAPTTTTKRRPKLIPIAVWAEETFGEYAPHRHTLLSWVKAGKIYPMPTKVGRSYFCSPDAEYFDPVVQKIRRMTGGSR
ncbi:hypothetical protein HHL24_17175 [Paraburkholderia sp. RP-4-7]|uniref:Excisionase-like domain-containing protein n=2 Tax=Paraburkholderia polaris TaxID=2728848 RepID=A0A848IBJ2_9BURK|nr:hypothetical protein [Paraburkholderia polaris]